MSKPLKKDSRGQMKLDPHETVELSPKMMAVLVAIAKAGRYGASAVYLKRLFGRWPGKTLRALLRRRLIRVNSGQGGRWVASGFVYRLLRVPAKDQPQAELFGMKESTP